MNASKTRDTIAFRQKIYEENESLDHFDPALMDAAARIMAALIGKYGVTKPTPGEADQLSQAAQTYAKALVQRVRA